MTSIQRISARDLRRRAATGLLAGLSFALACAASGSAYAQFSWPWDNAPAGRNPTQQPAPAWRPPPEPAPPAYAQPGAAAGPKPSICLQLEQRLVQETQNGSQSRDLVPMVESQLRQAEAQLRASQIQLDRSDCYDYFLFSKTLRRTRKCVDLSREAEGLKRQVADLETQRGQLIASSGRSYQDEIVRELARNSCGATYAQQAARRESSNPFSSLWQEDAGSTGGGLGGSFSSLPYATYRTMCVRLCDGYYFPISFSTLPNHFERDAEACQSKCAAPTELYYYQNPGGAVDQMVGAQTNTLYTQLRTAFRYRKEYVTGCSCKEAEFNTGEPGVQQQGAAPAAPDGAPAAQATAGGPADSSWSSGTTTTP